MPLGNSDPWCAILTSESSSDVSATILSGAAQEALQEGKDITFPGSLSTLGDATSSGGIDDDTVSGTSHIDMQTFLWQNRL